MSKLHYMLDLETLSTSKRPVILSYAVAAFTPDDMDPIRSISGTFEIFPQILLNQEIDKDTVDWWRKQPEDVQQRAIGMALRSPAEALRHIEEFVQDAGAIWSHGKDFDIPIINDLSKRVLGREILNRHITADTHTLAALTTIRRGDITRPSGSPHDAVFDAHWQAQWVRGMLFELSHKDLEFVHDYHR